MPFKDRRPSILLVDDEPANLHVLKHILQDDYRLLFARDGERALELASNEHPQLILLDVMMPGTTGHEVCTRLKADPRTEAIPVIFVTALANPEDEALGFELGAVDYISKPVSAPIVRARVRTHLSLVRAEVLRQTRLNIVQALGMAAEYKDNETGLHVIRMSHFSRIIALEAGFSAEDAEELLHAAPMHDVGKIGIPDAILQKPGKLDADEWAIMQQHPDIGARIIGEHDASMLQMARRIALGHHEKWDGSGYPAGLAGTDIPVEARIIAIADVFDALTSVRPYKRAWSVDEAVALIREQSGKHFDPHLVNCFLARLDEIIEIRDRWAE
ncbi:two-component system response regulator [Halopseudomonas pachastrellae]|jgi:putative two-component system response regulator|uniref:Two-component system response regulator n=1 Tax=Halopseudomonas pachastrellae TaxID=254161 RepID=A0A1S8DB20_9GAMM|nr:HD domain-containing phosphohydrolase [Halopseudomonas pachastrellae]ONM42583.1 two-component system response regulator [Halopseudomonas pachastrellae]SFL88398.1 putative two-component system response regulator [Halopseudomonas pachastrellae]HIQ53911.1 response regulator [Halopseudomonas pachastrellae]